MSLALMSFANTMQVAPEMRPRLNVGCLFDAANGEYVFGIHGESILNGGLSAFSGIAGLPNSYKSTIFKHFFLAGMNNYEQAHGQEYETEQSGFASRWEVLSMRYPDLDPYSLIYHATANPTGRLVRTDAATVNGNGYFSQLRQYADIKYKNNTAKELVGITPFRGKDGTKLKTLYPSIAGVDSLSRMSVDAVDTMFDKNQIGESGGNTVYLKEMAAKNQMIIQMPVLTAQSAIYFVATAHVSEKHQLDPYAPNVSKLAFLGRNLKLKYVPDQFNFLAQDLYFVFSASKCVTKDKTPLYPRDSQDNSHETTDLMTVTMMNLRGKSGLSGVPYEMVVSQTDGLLVGLTEFNHLKQYGSYGLGGNDRTYYLELLPDVKLSRTTIRAKLDEYPKLQRAMALTSGLLQIRNLWRNLEPGLLCEPAELYKDLIAMGYDWDELLSTRGYWVFEGSKAEAVPYLSAMDLLRMRKGLYKPYWKS